MTSTEDLILTGRMDEIRKNPIRLSLIKLVVKCFVCNEDVGIGQSTLDRFEVLPPAICQICYKNKVEYRAKTIAPPTVEDIRAIRQVKPDFNEEDWRRMEKMVKEKNL